jgi:hypothetical protein
MTDEDIEQMDPDELVNYTFAQERARITALSILMLFGIPVAAGAVYLPLEQPVAAWATGGDIPPHARGLVYSLADALTAMAGLYAGMTVGYPLYLSLRTRLSVDPNRYTSAERSGEGTGS